MDERQLIALIIRGAPANGAALGLSRQDENAFPAEASNEVFHLGRLFASVAAGRGAAPAIVTNAACWTYADLVMAARAVAKTLEAQQAFGPGERVILLLPNSAEYVAGFYGVLLAGGVVVPVPPKTEAGVLRGIIDSTEAVAVIANSQVVAARADLHGLKAEKIDLAPNTDVVKCVAELARVRNRGYELNSGEFRYVQESMPHSHPGGDDLAAIFFTGGSTGSPKGVMLNHRNLISNAQSIQHYLKITSAERPLCVLPFHHAFGNSVWQSHILAGATIVLEGQTTFPETIIAALARHECTSLSGVPDLHRILLERSSLGTTRLPKLRYMAVAGGALKHEQALEVARRIAPAEFFVMYGQTEATARLAFLPPAYLDKLPAGSIGRAVPDVILEIVDERDQPVARGTVGELRARGPNIMLGYWRNPPATAERIRSGWLYTGDLAVQDGDGWIALKGRKSSFVKIAGFRVDPGDLEEFAVRRLAASQAVAVAYESKEVGTRLALYLRQTAGAPSLAPSEMTARCRNELPRHFVPDLIQLVDEFPLNHALKIDRPLLSQLAETTAGSRRIPA